MDNISPNTHVWIQWRLEIDCFLAALLNLKPYKLGLKLWNYQPTKKAAEDPKRCRVSGAIQEADETVPWGQVLLFKAKETLHSALDLWVCGWSASSTSISTSWCFRLISRWSTCKCRQIREENKMHLITLNIIVRILSIILHSAKSMCIINFVNNTHKHMCVQKILINNWI